MSAGRYTELRIAHADVRLWSPPRAPRTPLPLLLVLDGRAYDEQASLTAWCARRIANGDLPPHRVALVDTADRNEDYSASAAYARVLADDVVASLARTSTVGVGASLGALALLHAELRHPGTFDGLFLQSGSFFVPRFDRHESGFRRYGRIVRFVRELQPQDLPITMTCGVDEENLRNNRVAAERLGAELHEVPGGHEYGSWRRALDPCLLRLLTRVWG